MYVYNIYIYIHPKNVFHQMPGLFSRHVGVQGQGMDDMLIAEKMWPDTLTVGSFTVVGKFY